LPYYINNKGPLL